MKFLNCWMFSAAFFLIALLNASFLSSATAPVDFFYRSNDLLVWNTSGYFSFYHDDGQLLWGGPGHPDRAFYFHNGQAAWKGFLRKEVSFSHDLSTVYHSNGRKAWLGASLKEILFSYDLCKVCHSNQQVAWYGAIDKECSFSYDSCTLYHSNGKIAWRGCSQRSSFSYDPCTFYHANGKVAWRGEFQNGSNDSVSACGVYYDNDQLAWSGRRGDPLFDKDGNIQTPSIESIYISLGYNSLLYISSNGYRNLDLSIGEGSYLRFSNQNESPTLSIYLGSGHFLDFLPREGKAPKLVMGNRSG